MRIPSSLAFAQQVAVAEVVLVAEALVTFEIVADDAFVTEGHGAAFVWDEAHGFEQADAHAATLPHQIRPGGDDGARGPTATIAWGTHAACGAGSGTAFAPVVSLIDDRFAATPQKHRADHDSPHLCNMPQCGRCGTHLAACNAIAVSSAPGEEGLFVVVHPRRFVEQSNLAKLKDHGRRGGEHTMVQGRQ